jgi:hypothetical protein
MTRACHHQAHHYHENRYQNRSNSFFRNVTAIFRYHDSLRDGADRWVRPIVHCPVCSGSGLPDGGRLGPRTERYHSQTGVHPYLSDQLPAIHDRYSLPPDENVTPELHHDDVGLDYENRHDHNPLETTQTCRI